MTMIDGSGERKEKKMVDQLTKAKWESMDSCGRWVVLLLLLPSSNITSSSSSSSGLASLMRMR